MTKKLIIVLLSPIFWASLSISVVSAQSGERINSFSSDIVLDQTGRATITETIEYDFGSNERRGIFRDVPIQYAVDGEQGYKLDFVVLGVSRDSNIEPYEILDGSPSFARLKIGNANVTISGSHTYEIIYTIAPVVIKADTGAEIARFDVPGTGWEVPINNVSATVSSPFLAPATNVCYQGFAGSLDQDCTIVGNSFSASRLLSPGETITAELAYDAGTFTNFAELTTIEQDYTTPVWIPITIFGVISSVVSFFGGSAIIGHIRHNQRKKEEIAYPRYEPPKDMGPAELGLLIDNSSSGAELSATIINLAVTGNIKIVQSKEKKWYRVAEYDFHKLSESTKGLKPYEEALLNSLFSGSEKTVGSKSLTTSQTFMKANQTFHKTLKKNLKNLGFYKKVSVFSPSLASRMSDEGYKKWAEVEGFREFLQLTEKGRLEMLEAPQRKPEQFSEYLPYAIALGVEDKWAKQFENLDIDTSDWYQGTGRTMNTALLASSLSSGLGSVAASANRSSGSSGSGGGFSGGGFSGGGGGSW